MIPEFKHCLNHLDIVIFSFYSQSRLLQITKRTIRANGNLHHMFKSNISRDVPNLYQDNASVNMTLNDFKFLRPNCRTERYQLVAFDMTEDNYTRRYSLGLKCMFVPDSSHFKHFK